MAKLSNLLIGENFKNLTRYDLKEDNQMDGIDIMAW